MNDAALTEATDLLAAMRAANAVPTEFPATCRPTTVAEGYRLQEALNGRLSAGAAGPTVGHKIGCTSRVMQEYLKINEPCSGAIHQSDVINGFGERAHRNFHVPGVECEIAVRLSRDLPPQDKPYDRASVADAVDVCMAAIEVVDDRWADFRNVSTPSMIADDFFNAGCTLGPPVADWRGIDMEAIEGAMFVNGEEIGRGHGRDVLGHPFEVLTWLANSFSSRGQTLHAGEVVLTGSLVETKWCVPGDIVRVEIDGLGETGITFTA